MKASKKCSASFTLTTMPTVRNCKNKKAMAIRLDVIHIHKEEPK